MQIAECRHQCHPHDS